METGKAWPIPDLVANMRRVKRTSREGRQALAAGKPQRGDFDVRETDATISTSPEAEEHSAIALPGRLKGARPADEDRTRRADGIVVAFVRDAW